MTLTERQAEMICERQRTATPEQYDFVPRRACERKPLREQPSDIREETVGRWIDKDPSEGYDYLAAAIWKSREHGEQFMKQIASLMICGDKCAIGDLVMKLATSAEMCDAAESVYLKGDEA